MIKVFDQNDRELYKYKLLSGENKFGSDTKQCQFLIRNVQPILFSVVLINRDVYFTHFSEEFEVYKESTLKSSNKVQIPKKFPIELIPGRHYYFQNYKFCLTDQEEQSIQQMNQVMQTQLIEEFSGTMQLDDILELPPIQQTTKISTTQLYAPTQVLGSQEYCCPTQIIDDCENKQTENSIQIEIASLQDLFSQYSMSKSSTNSTMQDSSTQTDPIEQTQPVQQKPTLFGTLFKSKSQQQPPQFKYQPPQQQNLDKTQLDSQLMGATVEDDDQLKFFDKKQNHDIGGTVIDEELEKAFSSQQINIIQEPKKLTQESSIFKRVNSIGSDQPQFSNQKIEQSSNIELNDLFGSLPDIPQQQIVQPQIIRKISNLKSNLFQIKQEDMQEEKSQFQDTPKKNNNQNHKESEKKKGKKKKDKDHAKKGDILKKITDEMSDESESDDQEQKPQNKKQVQAEPEDKNIRHTSSMELPSSKMCEEKGSGVVPKKKRGLRKKRLVNQKVFHYIVFSGFQESELPSQQQIQGLDLEVVDNQYEKFDLLIVKSPPKRTFKFLAALMLGAEIVTVDWLTDSIKHKELQNHQDYIPESQDFVNQFGLSIKAIIQSRDDHFESNDNTARIFENKYLVQDDVIPSKTEIEYLIRLGGGEIVKRASKNVTIISENKKGNSLSSDYILDACMFQQ